MLCLNLSSFCCINLNVFVRVDLSVVCLNLSLFYFKGYLSLPRLFYLRSNISEFVKNITSEVEYFSAAIFSISTVLMEIVILVPISIFLLATDFEISLVTIFVLVFYSILIYFFNAKIVNKLGKDRSKEINDRLKVILEFLGLLDQIIMQKRQVEDMLNLIMKSVF